MSWDAIVEYSMKEMIARGGSVHTILEAEAAIQDGIIDLQAASFPSQLGAAGTAIIPLAWEVYVFKALGAPYEEARDLLQHEETLSGLSQGFVMGMLGWKWHHVLNLFYRHFVLRIYHTDEALNRIRVLSYNLGLIGGFQAGRRLPEDRKKAVEAQLRKLAGHPPAGRWTKRDQINFVIDLGAAFRKLLVR